MTRIRNAGKVAIMATDSPSSQPDEGPAKGTTSEADSSPTPHTPPFTRAGAAWVATGAALLLLILIIVFILQNSAKVDVQFLGWSGTIPLGMALLIAAVGGGVVVAIAGVARVTQLRKYARRTKRSTTSP